MPRIAFVLFALVCAGCGSADREAAQAWPAVDAWLSSVEDATPDAALAMVRDGLEDVLGRRHGGDVAPTSARVAMREDGSRVLDAMWRVAYERGDATVEARAIGSKDGAWRVDACAIRSSAFTFVLR